MFKVIRDFVPNAPNGQFFVLCDRACGQFAYANIPPGPPQTEETNQVVWANQLLQGGWKITLAEQVCPAHVKQDREGKSLIIMPNMAAAAHKN